MPKRTKLLIMREIRMTIDALKERKTLAELSKEFEVHPNMITTWKREFVERSAVVFETDPPKTDFDEERERGT